MLATGDKSIILLLFKNRPFKLSKLDKGATSLMLLSERSNKDKFLADSSPLKSVIPRPEASNSSRLKILELFITSVDPSIPKALFMAFNKLTSCISMGVGLSIVESSSVWILSAGLEGILSYSE